MQHPAKRCSWDAVLAGRGVGTPKSGVIAMEMGIR
jgi:hypothetical protein